MQTLAVLCTLLLGASQVLAHMSIWTKSMYGVGNDFSYDAGNPVIPLGPDLTTQDSWWFRGPDFRALTPMLRTDGTVEQLPAGGSITLEIACHSAWTSYGVSPTVPGSALDACPGNPGAYHAGDPNAATIDDSLVSGCALAIADVDDISEVTMDNLAIFSVQHECVQQKETSFDIPAKMPACTGSKCICGWFWLANNGTGNFYMTAFDCAVTNAPADALPIAPPQDPVFCRDDPSTCTSGSKRPLYAYNSPSNAPFVDNYNRAGYHASWSFGTNGAQNDIFLTSATNTTSNATSSTVAPSSTSASTSLASSASSASASASSASASISSASASASVSASASSVSASASSASASTSLASSASSVSASASSVSASASSASASASSASSATSSVQPSSVASSSPTSVPTTSTIVSSTSVSSIVSSTSVSSATSVPSAVVLTNYAAGTANGASTWTDNHEWNLATDGKTSTSWVSNGETVNAWLSLDFGGAIALNQVVLYDLPSTTDQITNCGIMLSSQEILYLGPLNNDGSATTFNFTTRYTTSLLFGVFSVSDSTESAGLTEIQVFNNPDAVIGSSATTTVPAASASSAAAALSSAAVSATGGTATSVATTATSSAPTASATALTNYALTAQKSASSWLTGWEYTKATDGKTATVWVSNGELAGAWYGLQFSSATTVNQVVLYGRPNAAEQVTNCAIQFSDGSILPLGPLNADGSATTFNFTAKQTTTLFWGALAVTSTATRVGLTEFQVFNNPNAVIQSTAVPAQSSANVVASIQSIAADAVSAVTSAVSSLVSTVVAPSQSSVAVSTTAPASSAKSASASSTTPAQRARRSVNAPRAVQRHPRDFLRRAGEEPEPETTSPVRRSFTAEGLFVGISPVWDAPVESA